MEIDEILAKANSFSFAVMRDITLAEDNPIAICHIILQGIFHKLVKRAW